MPGIVDTRSAAGAVAPPASPAPPATHGSPPGVRKGPGLIRLAAGLMIVNATTYLAIFGVLNVILPAQIAIATGEAGKEAALQVVFQRAHLQAHRCLGQCDPLGGSGKGAFGRGKVARVTSIAVAAAARSAR